MLGEATGLRKVYPRKLSSGWRSTRGEVRPRGGGGGERRPGQLIQNGHIFCSSLYSDVYCCIVAPYLLFLVVWNAA